jgi:3-methylcrotonyl-CoA carboxylase alpha subunit
LLDHPEVRAGGADTGLIGRARADLIAAGEALPEDALALAALAELERRRAEVAVEAAESGDPHSPWHTTTGWRLNVETHLDLRFAVGEVEQVVRVRYRPEAYLLDLPSGSVDARGRLADDGTLDAEIGGRRLRGAVVRRGHDLTVLLGPRAYRLIRLQPLAGAESDAGVDGTLTAPMPGKITKVAVEAGAEVDAGATLMVLEAMKMEHTIVAPAQGRVAEVRYRMGDQVEEGTELLVFEAAAEKEAGAA